MAAAVGSDGAGTTEGTGTTGCAANGLGVNGGE
jgi:hypothetical protein